MEALLKDSRRRTFVQPLYVLLNRTRTFGVDLMEFDGPRMEDDDNDEDDAAFQYMIEQSLLESSKKREIPREPTTGHMKRSEWKTATISLNPAEQRCVQDCHLTLKR